MDVVRLGSSSLSHERISYGTYPNTGEQRGTGVIGVSLCTFGCCTVKAGW